jgi:cytochrome c oxidase assembly factor CtaG
MRLLKRARCLAGVLAALAPAAARAHLPPGYETRWTLDPWIVAPLLAAAALYALGAAELGRRSRRAAALHRRRIACFCAGWAVLAGALVSPLHAAGERSFAAHMLEHELLMLVAAPLLVLGRPLGFFAWGLPRPLRRLAGRVERSGPFAAVWRFLVHPVPATILQAVALWAWHAPGPFDLALREPGWHVVQHLSFLASALLFWSAVLDAHRTAARPALAAGCLFATTTIGGALGALMAFSWSPWYPAYAALGLTPLGLTPVEDQQLAGLLMWIPGGLVHMGAALAILGRVLREERPDRTAPPMRVAPHGPPPRA